jgi:protein phosphatase
MGDNEMLFFGKSITGRRKNNEDSFLAERINNDTVLLAVADGMGGAIAGEVASKTVITEISKFIKEELSVQSDHIDLKAILDKAYGHVQIVVRDLIEKRAEYAGMGTTLTVLLVHKNRYVWGNIGDSRLYRLTEGRIDLLTRDHTHIQELLDKGETPDPDYVAMYSNLITKCINGATETPDIFPELEEYMVLDSDVAFLLCSDGLILNGTDDDNDSRIYQTYFSIKNLAKTPDAMIEEAYELGSNDNITVVVMEQGMLKKESKAKERVPYKIKGRLYSFVALFVISALLLLTVRYVYLNNNTITKYTDIKKVNANIWIEQFTIHETPYSSQYNTIKWKPYPDTINLEEIQLILYDRLNQEEFLISDTLNSGEVSLNRFNPQLFNSERYPVDTEFADFNLSIQAKLNSDSIVYGDTCEFSININ